MYFFSIQRRVPTFNNCDWKYWRACKNGYGDLNGSFWMGLEMIHQVVSKVGMKYQKQNIYIGLSNFSFTNTYVEKLITIVTVDILNHLIYSFIFRKPAFII